MLVSCMAMPRSSAKALGFWGAHAEHAAHHQADGAGDAVAVAQQLGVVGEGDRTGVGADAGDEFERGGSLDVVVGAAGPKTSISGGRRGLAAQLGLDLGERGCRPRGWRPRRRGRRQGGRRRRARRPRPAARARGSAPRGRSCGRAGPARPGFGDDAGAVDHQEAARVTRVGAGTGTRCCGPGITRSSTLADESTPGMPAPGGVPAPTK